MPLASLANLQWYGPASLAVVDDAVSEEFGSSLKAWGAIRSVDDAISTETVSMTRGRNMSLFDDAISEDLGSSMKQSSAIRFLEDVGDRPSAEAIAQAVWGQALAAFTTTGSAGDQLKKALTTGKFLGLK